MEVREASAKYSRTTGYKQTEVGVIPEDWSLSELQGLCRETITYGIVQCGPHIENGVPYIRVSDMDGYELDVTGMLRTSPTIARKFSRSTVQEGDIVFALRGKLGDVRPVGPSVAGANLTQGTARLSPNKNLASKYLLWAMRSPRSLQQAELQAKGTTFREITLADLRRIKIPLPPTKAEQEAIAEALSDADALIESLEQLLAKKRHLKQGAMQQLLTGKKRLPGFSGEWEVKRLGECLTSRPDYGINAAAVSYSDRLPTYIRITDISDDGRFAPDSLVSVAHTDAAHYYLSDGDLVLARTGASVGKSYLYNPLDGQLVFAGFLIRVRPDPAKLVPAFLSNFVQTGRYWSWVKLMSMRSGQPGINGNEFAQLPITCPSVTEQTAIATLLSDMDAELAALEAKLAKARDLKQGMMQELLTGRIRLV